MGFKLVRRQHSSVDQREWQIFAGEAAGAAVPELVAAAEWLRGVYFQGLSRNEEQLLRVFLSGCRI